MRFRIRESDLFDPRIRDPEWNHSDPVSVINIPDTQHWSQLIKDIFCAEGGLLESDMRPSRTPPGRKRRVQQVVSKCLVNVWYMDSLSKPDHSYGPFLKPVFPTRIRRIRMFLHRMDPDPQIQKWRNALISTVFTVICFVWVSGKFGTCTVVNVNVTLVEDKMLRCKGESAHFSFNKCHIYTYDGASAKFSTNSHVADYNVVTS